MLSAFFLIFMSTFAIATGPVVKMPSCEPNKKNGLLQLSTYFKEQQDLRNNRSSIDEYARKLNISVDEAKRMFSASGVVRCPWGKGSAQIAVKNNVLVTAAHMFYDETCRKRFDVTKCTFEKSFETNEELRSQNGKGPKRYKIKLGKGIIGKCSPEGKSSIEQDMAVVELTEDVENVIPYKIPSSSVLLSNGNPLIQVSSHAINYKDSKTPYIAECEVMGTDWKHPALSDINLPVATSCATDKGASGSAQMKEISVNGAKYFEIQSIAVWANSASKDGDIASFKDAKFNGSVPMAGKFLYKLQEYEK